jgi:pilus assembly protein CpaE
MSANISVVPSAQDEPVASLVRNRIVAFVSDDLSAAALRHGLEGTNLEVKRGTIRDAVRMLATDTEIFGLVVDTCGMSDPLAELEALSSICPPDVLVTVIGDSDSASTYRTIVNDMGAREYLPKPITRDVVHRALRSTFVGEAEPVDRGGHVISLCGAQGGAGTTSIAVNLALALAETTKAKVALLDLHLQGGEMAVMLGVQPGPGLRIALEDPMRADTLFIERAAIDINDRVKLIAADEDLDTALQITDAGVRHVLGLLRQRFNYIVVDVPVPLVPAIHAVITLSRQVLVTLEAEVTGLRNANILRKVVAGIAGKNKVFTVLNRANRPGGLPTGSVVKGLGAEPDMVIPDLGKGMTQAVNLGIPALHRVRPLRKHLAPIVREIAGVGAQRNGWWRFLGR